MSILIQVKFLSFLESKYPNESKQFEEKGIADKKILPRAFDEFVIEQAQSIGLRVLFSPSVLKTLYHWTQQPDAGTKLWRRFAKAIQNGFDKKQIIISDQRIPLRRDELIDDLKKLKPRLRSKKATDLPWNFSLHLRNLENAMEKFDGEVLASNGTRFVTFVKNNEELYKGWILPNCKVTDTKLAQAFIADSYRYTSPESARQSIQKLKRRSRLKRPE